MNYLFKLLFVTLIALPLGVKAQCDIPLPNDLNTGSNMTILMTGSFFSQAPILNDDAYLVVLSSDGEVVGDNTVNGSTSSVAAWGDDSSTPEKDGLSSGEVFSLQLVNGIDLYNISNAIFQNGSFTFTINATAVLVSAEFNICLPNIEGCTDLDAFNFDIEANIDNGTCIAKIFGCMDAIAFNYDENANTNSGCVAVVIGCTDSTAFNYDAFANTNAGCEAVVLGCTETSAFNYNENANTNDVSCIDVLEGCIDVNAFNYNENANTDDGSCIAKVFGCIDAIAFNFNENANTSDGSCIALVEGCTNTNAFNYNQNATTDDGSCVPVVEGCTDVNAFNFNEDANADDASCEAIVYGCMDIEAYNYDPLANIDNNICIDKIFGCTSEQAVNYDSIANTDDGSCQGEILGCVDIDAFNFDPVANTDDGSCIEKVFGCTDTFAYNYDPDANTDNNLCEEIINGCKDPSAFNYYSSANTDDGSCIEILVGCTDLTAYNFNELANTNDGSCEAVVLGCTDEEALNFYISSNTDDGSCLYNIADIGCELPLEYPGTITGSNMNILFTVQFTNELSIVSQDAYVVGISTSDLTVGSSSIESGEMASITLWGDDVGTDQIDGATSWEQINLSIVDGGNFYKIILNDNIIYHDNETLIITDSDINQIQTICMDGYYTQIPIYGCLDPLASNYIDPIDDISVDVNTENGTCDYGNQSNCLFPEQYNGSFTGNNMSLLFTDVFMSSLSITELDAYIVAVNGENITFGSIQVNDTEMVSLSIWGDDIGTPIIDGFIGSETIRLYLVNGSNMYEIEPYIQLLYSSNGMLVFDNPASVISICTDGLYVHLEGCIDENASNYNPSATDNDGSCLYVYGCMDESYIEFNSLATADDGSCLYAISRIQELEMIESLYYATQEELELCQGENTPIPIDLYPGWNLIGYSLNFPQNTAACFDPISDNIVIAKSNYGWIYWPEYGYNGIGDLIPGMGYQVFMTTEVDDFTFIDVGGLRIDLEPTVPQWAIDLAPIHPNDIKTLVRIVNLLGQEVDAENQTHGTPLLYLYNDGTVTKMISK